MKKKVIIIVFSLMFIIGLAGTFWSSSIAEAASGIWNSCERGKVNCAYPGDCRSYIDTNGDSICDRSQSNPQSSLSSTTSGNVVQANSSITTAVAGSAGTTNGTEGAITISNNRSYYFIPIFAVLVILYSVTWILSTRKIMRNLWHRRIWNMILLASSLVSALLGLILTLNIDFGTNITPPFNMLFWHVEAGIALGIVALFHIFWHWRYFAKILRIPSE